MESCTSGNGDQPALGCEQRGISMESTTAWIVGGLMGVFALVAVGADYLQSNATPPLEVQRVEQHWTKAQFRSAVEQMTKAQVRNAFGSPGLVQDSNDSWLYSYLPVYDEAAGTKVGGTWIKFEGLSDPDKDQVAQVSFD